VTEFARRIKHQLSDVPAVEDFLMPNAPPARLSRAELAALAAPLLDRTVTCCAELLTRLGVPAHDLAAVLMVGGAARMPAVAETLSTLGAPPRSVAAPELATVLGAARWLPSSGPRRVAARTSPEPVIPLSFAIPGGAARLLHWLVLPGQAYLAGVPLARVRLPGGALWDLVAATPGTLDRLLVPPGADVAAHEWLAFSRP
jgi:hypothetical protein